MIELVERLRTLVELESPTGSTEAMQVQMAAALARLGGDVRLIDDHLRVEFPGSGAPLLLLGHLDTVWPEGTLARFPFRIEEGRAYGPGAYDMKAGLVIMLEAIAQAGTERRALRVFLTADEEMGSRSARPHLEAAARGVAAALVVEPPLAGGGLKTSRKGLGRFRITVTGRAAHAGTSRADGCSAIEELAHQILRLHAWNDEERGVSVNVGVVHGGTAENVVAAQASADVDVRVSHAEDVVFMEHALAELEPVLQGASLEVTGGWTRPPLERSPGSALLFTRAREAGLELGLDLTEGSSGGGSDGNLVGALGVPVLDGLGAEGGGAHADDEHVLIESLPVRARLLAALLRDPGL